MNNEFISIMTERIVRDFDPLQIILFGSQARGDAYRDSDIDMLVVFAELTEAVEQARSIWTSVSNALTAHGYHAEQDL